MRFIYLLDQMNALFLRVVGLRDVEAALETVFPAET